VTKSPKERLEQVVGATLLKIGLDLLEEHREDLVRIGGDALSKITRAVVTGRPDPAWLERCRNLSAHTDKAVRAQLDAHPKPTGLHVAATGELLPVRDFDQGLDGRQVIYLANSKQAWPILLEGAQWYRLEQEG